MRHGRTALLAVAALLTILLGITLARGRPAADSGFFQTLPRDRTVVFAHRGGARLWPENTLLAFAGAVDLGADALEMDVFFTADRVPVVLHDSTVDRTTDGTGPVSSFSLERLQHLDAGFRFRPLDGADEEFPYRGQGVRIPTLREVFDEFPGIHTIVEIKENDTRLADAMIDLVREFNRENRTLIGSFHREMLQYVRESAPEIATHGSEREVIMLLVASWLRLEGVISPAYEAVLVPQRSGPIPVTTRRFIRGAQGRNLHVGAWTINDPEEMRELVRLGIDGLVTDRPDLALGIVGSPPD